MRLYPLFFVSGAAALGYQIAWTKMFALGLGHEFPAAAAVIGAFFGGMGLGAIASKRLLKVLGTRAFAWIELSISVWGALTPWLIQGANDIALRAGWFVAFLGAFLVLLPATVGMGASLPAMAAVARIAGLRRGIGAAYAANTLGAVFGCLGAAYVWMPLFGLHGAVWLCAGANLFVAMMAFQFARAEVAWPRRETLPWPLAATLFCGGLLAIAWEALGIRLLSQVLENTIFSMAVILAVYLAGQAIGAAIWRNFGRGDGRWLFPALALVAVGSVWVFGLGHNFYASLRSSFGNSTGAVMLSELLVSASVFLLPTIAMGAAFVALVERAGELRLGPAIFVNSLGSAAAAVCTPLLFPMIGAFGILALISAGYAALAGRLWLATAALVAGGLFLAPNPLRLVNLPPAAKIIDFREGRMANVAVAETPDGARTLYVNNRFQMGGSAAEIPELRHGHIPLLLHPGPRRALFLGLGTGITMSSARAHPQLFADGVELLPEVVEMMPSFVKDLGPSSQVHIADARRFIRQSPNRYDVIVADLFHPAQDGAAFLYTREHFARVKERLAEGGLFCQWLPLHQLDLQNTKTIVRTFLEVFPEAEAFLLRFNIDAPVVGLFGWKNGPPTWDENWVEQREVGNVLGPELRRLALADSIRLFGCYLAGPAELHGFAGAGRLNTDSFPVILFEAPRFSFQRGAPTYERLVAMLDALPKAAPAIGPPEFRGRLGKFIQARDVYFRALVAEAKGQGAQAIDGYVESARLSEDFTSGYAQCLALARAKVVSDPQQARRILERLAEAQPNRPVAGELLRRLFP